jgi:hypothetical protein
MNQQKDMINLYIKKKKHVVYPRQNKLEIPNDEEEVNTREIHKCDGQADDPDTMVAPPTPKPTRKAEALVKTPLCCCILLLFIMNR